MTRGGVTLIAAGAGILIATAAIGTPADADLWGHLTFGRDIALTGQPEQPDRYSFTTDRPWVNHEWLAEAVFFRVYDAAGSAGLVALKVAIIALALALVWRQLACERASVLVMTVLLCLTFAGTYWRTHSVRPQLFSVVLFATVLCVMARVDDGRRRMLWLIPPVMALWVNLHGGWIVGAAAVAIWAAWHAMAPARTRRSRASIVAVSLTALAATVVNPFGLEMWSFLHETVGLQRSDIQDWAPVWRYPAQLGLPWAVTAAAAGFAFWSDPAMWRRIDRVAIVGGLLAMSFFVSRLDAFLALAVVVLLSRPLAAGLGRQMRTSPSAGRAASPAALRLITSLAVIIMSIGAMPIVRSHAACLPIAGAWAPDADAARFITTNQLRGTLLTWFDWGQYAIWHFAPDLRVSMDGRRETVYSADLIAAHWRFYAAEDAPSVLLGRLEPDFIWLPRHLPVVRQLAAEGWTPVFDGSVSQVFARAGTGPFAQAPLRHSARRCFPGP
jgi:hypothetical protein